MKKKYLLLLPVIALFGVMAFAFKPVNTFNIAYAETSEVAPSQENVDSQETTSEEESKWKTLYEEANKKLEEVKNYQFLGTTIGSVIGAATGILFSLLLSRVSKDSIRDLREFGRSNIETAKEFYQKGKELQEQGREAIELGKELLKEATDLKNEVISEAQVLKDKLVFEEKTHKEDVQMLLSIISNDPTLVANGTAEKINKLFND